MGASIASYECRVNGWDWKYELVPDKLIVNGTGRFDRKRIELELKKCDEVLDRGVKAHVVRYPRRVRIVAAMVILATALLFGVVIGITTILEVRFPGQHEGKELIPFALSFLFFESLIMAFGLPVFLQESRTQCFFTLKRASDGDGVLTLHSAVDARSDSFEAFMAEVASEIQRARLGPPSPGSFQEALPLSMRVADDSNTDMPLSIYEAVDAGWHWVYTLVPYRLVLKGCKGSESHQVCFELSHCDDVPDRGATDVFRLPRSWSFWALVASSVLLFSLTGVIVVVATDLFFLPGQSLATSLLACGFFYGNAPLFLSLCWLYRKRLRRSYASFKRVSDGAVLFTLATETDGSIQEFEEFVSDVIVGIQVSRGDDPDLGHCIIKK